MRCTLVRDGREGELKTWVSHILLPPRSDRRGCLRASRCPWPGWPSGPRTSWPQVGSRSQDLCRVTSLSTESPGSLTPAASQTSAFSGALWRGFCCRRADKPGPHACAPCGFGRPHVCAASGTVDGSAASPPASRRRVRCSDALEAPSPVAAGAASLDWELGGRAEPPAPPRTQAPGPPSPASGRPRLPGSSRWFRRLPEFEMTLF